MLQEASNEALSGTSFEAASRRLRTRGTGFRVRLSEGRGVFVVTEEWAGDDTPPSRHCSGRSRANPSPLWERVGERGPSGWTEAYDVGAPRPRIKVRGSPACFADDQRRRKMFFGVTCAGRAFAAQSFGGRFPSITSSWIFTATPRSSQWSSTASSTNGFPATTLGGPKFSNASACA